MSDFIYSSIPKNQGELTEHIQSIYHQDVPEVYEFHGGWGSLGVSHNLYNGLQPVETNSHIFVVIGGPVICFSDNKFLSEEDPVAGTKKILCRYETGEIQWDEELSGPFVILSINKANNNITCITDLMMFIPVYHYLLDGKLVMGTHIDSVAKASGQENSFDPVSLADFIINDVVTYPYTTYKKIRQLHPAAIHKYTHKDRGVQECEPDLYWIPEERDIYKNINEAATELRKGIQDYINKITEGMTEIAQFISAGEDSRVIAGLLPKSLKRDGFIFLDNMNREGEIAEKVTQAYGINFYPQFRSKTHYLEILPEASDLVGSGYQYLHAHSLGFHKTCKLDQYHAVFGGYLGDAFLKGLYTRKLRGQTRMPFLPEIGIKGETRSKPINNTCFYQNINNNITARRLDHLNEVKKYRKSNMHEWFSLWPSSMRQGLPYFSSNRRLLKTYEPFSSKEVVKICAIVPVNWKLNRRLFKKAMNPFLKESKWLSHTKGFFPYFPWWFNILPQFIVWIWRGFAKTFGIIKGHQGSWGDWKEISSSQIWNKSIHKYGKNNLCSDSFLNVPIKNAFKGNYLKRMQKVNLLQVMYFLKNNQH